MGFSIAKSNREHPNPTTKIGPKMGGEFTYQPKWDPIGSDPQPEFWRHWGSLKSFEMPVLQDASFDPVRPSVEPLRIAEFEQQNNLALKQTNKQANKQTTKQTNKQTSKQTNNQTNKQTNKQPNKQNKQNKQTNKKAHKHTPPVFFVVCVFCFGPSVSQRHKRPVVVRGVLRGDCSNVSKLGPPVESLVLTEWTGRMRKAPTPSQAQQGCLLG